MKGGDLSHREAPVGSGRRPHPAGAARSGRVVVAAGAVTTEVVLLRPDSFAQVARSTSGVAAVVSGGQWISHRTGCLQRPLGQPGHLSR